jgi:hypothetical protein
MNYASAFLVLILSAAAIFWYTNGRRYYTGPLIEAQVEDRDSNSGGDTPQMDSKAEV